MLSKSGNPKEIPFEDRLYRIPDNVRVVVDRTLPISIVFFGQGPPCFSMEGNIRSFFLDKTYQKCYTIFIALADISSVTARLRVCLPTGKGLKTLYAIVQ